MSEDEIDDAWTDAQAVPDGPHSMRAEIDNAGPVRLVASCQAAVNAPCHLSCSDSSCDRYPCSHMPTLVAYCNVVEFLNAEGDMASLYDGDTAELRSGSITYEWDGDCYVWDYPVEATS